VTWVQAPHTATAKRRRNPLGIQPADPDALIGSDHAEALAALAALLPALASPGVRNTAREPIGTTTPVACRAAPTAPTRPALIASPTDPTVAAPQRHSRAA